ncbi:MAG: hypothetical protein E7272_12710 [Pseudobutyrivibrio ruminis]|uniref:Uncharacterized protein n=1 Tax=Pseudobutyrivibrio ruminis TaxID=46206 RepID=A0A927YME3_9FIRM|nr:hypothetical protein [Pseudobutyrivibrio ruminis]
MFKIVFDNAIVTSENNVSIELISWAEQTENTDGKEQAKSDDSVMLIKTEKSCAWVTFEKSLSKDVLATMRSEIIRGLRDHDLFDLTEQNESWKVSDLKILN